MQGMMEDLGGNICEIKVRYNLGINILVLYLPRPIEKSLQQTTVYK